MENVHSLPLNPLHGVEILGTQKFPQKQNNYPYQLELNVSDLTRPTPQTSPIWTLLDNGERYTSLVQLFKHTNNYELTVKCQGQGSFVFDDSSMQVSWNSQGTNFEHYLQSIGLACWLELKGVPCIHANAISINGNAYLIIAPSRTGKSTLTTHLITQGFKLMTDDMAAIHVTADSNFRVYPSWPKIRLWPDVADSLVGMEVDSINNKSDGAKTNTAQISTSNKDLNAISVKNKNIPNHIGATKIKHVHQKFAKFEIEMDQNENSAWQTKPQGLKGIYFLERHADYDGQCDINRLKASKGLMLLLQNSILADAYKGMGIEIERMGSLAKILESVPIHKICYQSGLEHLSLVSKTLKQHIITL
jgi:hypothetical protein